VNFSFGTKRVLQDISFEAQGGEILGILGPNGSGKTTLLRCICQILKLESGQVFYDEQDLSKSDLLTRARIISMVPQAPPPLPFSVFDVVCMGRYPHIPWFHQETVKDLEIVHQALSRTGVLDLARRQTGTLSGGELQRVFIARAIAQDPAILLLDEPTAHLDIKYQLEILNLVRILTRERKMVTLLVSHDLNFATRFCDQVLLLDAGRCFAYGPAGAVITPENIKAVYGVNVEVTYHERTRSYNVVVIE
jgi:iron complex transport system ATP-binding protein